MGYENNNIAYNWQYTEEDGGGIKCKNYELCEEVLSKEWFKCKGTYLCTNCDRQFGTWKNEEYGVYKTGKGILEISDNLECPICLEINRGVSQPNCKHTVCIECFKRCYYGDKSGYPVFPYSEEIMNEWENDEDNIKWYRDYPLIKVFDEEWEKWNNKGETQYQNEEYLRKCPICRK